MPHVAGLHRLHSQIGGMGGRALNDALSVNKVLTDLQIGGNEVEFAVTKEIDEKLKQNRRRRRESHDSIRSRDPELVLRYMRCRCPCAEKSKSGCNGRIQSCSFPLVCCRQSIDSSSHFTVDGFGGCPRVKFQFLDSANILSLHESRLPQSLSC